MATVAGDSALARPALTIRAILPPLKAKFSTPLRAACPKRHSTLSSGAFKPMPKTCSSSMAMGPRPPQPTKCGMESLLGAMISGALFSQIVPVLS